MIETSQSEASGFDWRCNDTLEEEEEEEKSQYTTTQSYPLSRWGSGRAAGESWGKHDRVPDAFLDAYTFQSSNRKGSAPSRAASIQRTRDRRGASLHICLCICWHLFLQSQSCSKERLALCNLELYLQRNCSRSRLQDRRPARG